MKNKDNRPEQTAVLRRQAEEIVQEKAAKMTENQEALSPEETRQMLHELRVHQIELEMQNEELRLAQAEMDAARVRYFDLYDLAPVGYVTVSEKGMILEANLTAATLLGVVRSALVRQPISLFILNEDQDIYYRHRKQLFETGEPQACELRMVKKDGTAFWAHLEATAAQDDAGEPVYRVVLSDITERKQAEEALRESEEKYRSLVETAQELIWKCDERGRFTYLNPAWEKTHGYKVEEMIERTFGEFQPPEIFERDRIEFSRHMAGGSVKEYETIHHAKDGSN